MSEVLVPRTPTPGSKGSRALTSTPPLPATDLTPPPSTQAPRHADFAASLSKDPVDAIGGRLASPPVTTRPTPNAGAAGGTWKGPFPTLEQARSLPDGQLRDLVLELIPALGESRMALAHAKLQLNLLTIEAAEAAKRAEAEHDLTRREVEVLQSANPTLRARAALSPDPRSGVGKMHHDLEAALRRNAAVEEEAAAAARRLRQAKKVIRHLDARNGQLAQDNSALRERIRQNRHHFNEMRAAGVYVAGYTPKHAESTPRRKGRAGAGGDSGSGAAAGGASGGSVQTPRQDALGTLLMADQLLSGGAGSVPSTPTPYRAVKYSAGSGSGVSGHTRGTQSLSSLPSTPNRAAAAAVAAMARPAAQDDTSLTPINQIVPARKEKPRYDRDSTISASEDEGEQPQQRRSGGVAEVLTDEDLPASQASKAASGMLRQSAAAAHSSQGTEGRAAVGYSGPSSKGSPRMGEQERKAKKGGRAKRGRGSSDEEGGQDRRKAVRGGVGLGIEGWKSP